MVVFDRLWSGRAVTEHRYVFLFFVCVYMYVSNHFNHCIKLFAPCGPLIGNKNSYSYSILIVKMYKDKEVNKNIKNILLSMWRKSVFDIYFTDFGTALTTILPILFQYCLPSLFELSFLIGTPYKCVYSYIIFLLK